MHTFDYSILPGELMEPEVANLVSTIHEFKGKQDLFVEARSDVLDTLCQVAKVQSTEASNRIEGINTSNSRLNKLMAEKTTPRNRAEEEIIGYRDALSTIRESYDHIDVKPSVILQLHRDLYRYTSTSHGGRWKNSDNAIVESDGHGGYNVRFSPLPAVATPEAMDELCKAFDDAIRANRYDPLLLACMFTFDFICIHPFNDGNGRMSRLLTLLLLYRSGYLVGKYISLEKAIERSKKTYYEALRTSSDGWHDDTNSYAPFVRYLLGIVLGAYRDFSDRVENLSVGRKSKAERVADVFERRVGKVTKADILAECPDISMTTVERTLKELLENGHIEKIGKGRATGYVKKNNTR